MAGQHVNQVPVNQYITQTSVNQHINQLPINQQINSIPLSQIVQTVQNSTLGASGIRASRVNFVPPVQVGQPTVQNGQFQTVRPSTVFVKQP